MDKIDVTLREVEVDGKRVWVAAAVVPGAAAPQVGRGSSQELALGALNAQLTVAVELNVVSVEALPPPPEPEPAPEPQPRRDDRRTTCVVCNGPLVSEEQLANGACSETHRQMAPQRITYVLTRS
jgi:hypothetical protein